MYRITYYYKTPTNFTNVKMQTKEEFLEMLDLLTTCPNVINVIACCTKLMEKE